MELSEVNYNYNDLMLYFRIEKYLNFSNLTVNEKMRVFMNMKENHQTLAKKVLTISDLETTINQIYGLDELAVDEQASIGEIVDDIREIINPNDPCSVAIENDGI